MTPAVQKNIISGAGLAVFGLLFALYAILQLPIGTFSSMGPGMFPMLVGFILVVTGILIMAPAIREASSRQKSDDPGKWDTVEVKPLILVLIAMGAFALLIEPFGVIVSTVALVGICALASGKLKLPQIAAVSATLIVSTYVIFIWALKMPLDLWNWPF